MTKNSKKFERHVSISSKVTFKKQGTTAFIPKHLLTSCFGAFGFSYESGIFRYIVMKIILLRVINNGSKNNLQAIKMYPVTDITTDLSIERSPKKSKIDTGKLKKPNKRRGVSKELEKQLKERPKVNITEMKHIEPEYIVPHTK